LVETALPRAERKFGGFRFGSLLPAALTLGAGALILISHSLPWWSFKLYAPQYPQGLGLEVLLSGVRGDVREIDMLNHYIGMSSLAHAAPLERQYSSLAVALVGLLTVGLSFGGRRARVAAVLVAAGFPLGFVADCFYWLYRFGHGLDPRAPLDLAPFTPELFGNGQIGQFMTFARPELGFWCAVGAAALALLVLVLRRRPAAQGA
jgi:hypothetical protein